MSWFDRPRTPLTPVIVHEKGPPDRPVLYDHRGKPLVPKSRRIGFQPPTERKP